MEEGESLVFFAIGVDPSFIHLSLSALAVSCPARVGRIWSVPVPVHDVHRLRTCMRVLSWTFCLGVGLGVGSCLCTRGGPAGGPPVLRCSL